MFGFCSGSFFVRSGAGATPTGRTWAEGQETRRQPARPRGGTGPFGETRLSSPLGDKNIYCKVTIDNDGHYIHWKRVRGDLVHVEGFFKIRQKAHHPEYAYIDYGSYIDPGGIGRILMTNAKRERSINRMIR